MRFGQTGVVKRSTAIRHLVTVAEAASDRMQLRATDIGWPLEELWVTGTLLDPIDELEHGSVVLMINLPPDEMPWLAVHPTAEWIGDQLRLGKRPLWWSYRPTGWPPWTYRDRRVARFWSAISGLDDEAIDALNTGRPTAVVEPDRDELLDQLDVELPVAKAHLRSILDRYWDQEWRRANRHDTSLTFTSAGVVVGLRRRRGPRSWPHRVCGQFGWGGQFGSGRASVNRIVVVRPSIRVVRLPGARSVPRTRRRAASGCARRS